MITPALIIRKKREGKELAPEEIQGFIHGLSSGEVTDYQATAWLMAVFFRGLSLEETVALTRAMVESGERYDLSAIQGPKVDKHSTGGVGDKVSLILAPLASACGLKVPMMSGRGLGHSGGTLDKLESIPGFDVKLSRARFEQVLSKVGCAMIGQSEKIVPADRKLYSLRDVTATVECIPLIVASILSKKIAEGTDALVLDVKVGSGAFMKTREQAKRLAQTITRVAKNLGLPCRAILTDMNQPLGYAVGNSLEVRECVEVMKNEKVPGLVSSDLKELTIHLCAQMLELGKIVKSQAEGRKLATAKLNDGSAWRVFQELVREQGGALDRPLPIAPQLATWKASKRGYITRFDTEAIGRILVELGGGRKKASDKVDPGVGLVFLKKLGAKVQAGEPIAQVYAPAGMDLSGVEGLFQDSVEITGARKPVPKLVFGRV